MHQSDVTQTSEAVAPTPLAAAAALAGSARVGDVLRITGGALLVAAGAQFVRLPVPGTDVPMTLQLAAVLILAFSLPALQAMAAIGLYLASGVAGLPVFAGAGGLLGPTGGYLVGFLIAAWLVSTLRGRGRAGWWRLLASGAAGTVVVFAFGVLWRIVLFRGAGPWAGDVTLAVITGVAPFVLKAMLELLFAVTLAVSVRNWRAAHRRAPRPA